MMPVKPGFKQFLNLTSKGNLIPVWTEVLADLETPVSSFLKIDRSPYAFLLESVEGGQSQARYSFLGTDPAIILECTNGKLSIRRKGGATTVTQADDPLVELKRVLKPYRFVQPAELPRFCGGAVGFMGYDCNRFYEKIRPYAQKGALPDMCFMIADSLLVFDHVRRRIQIVSNAFISAKASPAQKRKSYELAITKIQALADKLGESTAPAASLSTRNSKKAPTVSSNMSQRDFERKVKRVKEYIRRGDVIQAVLSQRFRMNYSCNDFNIYRALRSINPSPYMFYLKCDDFSLVGSSPEVHVRSEEGKVTLRPIAGTRPRGRNAQEDAQLAEGLLRDPKERAEHVMLVDLGRNDLGRISRIGSVSVEQFMTIERYSHVMHIVSQVNGELRSDKSPYDVIRATFPAGTVSGAPKVRAMEIIRELEPQRRGPYAGLVGYLGFSGNLDTCITIRTVLLKDRVAYVQAGAGIVADSDPKTEWNETHNKARGVLKAIEMAERGLR